MEFLIVRFPESREVRADGAPQGKTNLILQFEAGKHIVTLGPPWNFSPVEQKVLLQNCKVEFHLLPPAAIPHGPGGSGA